MSDKEEQWGLIESRRLVNEMKVNLYSDGLHDAAQCVRTSLENEKATIERLMENSIFKQKGCGMTLSMELDRIDQILEYI